MRYVTRMKGFLKSIYQSTRILGEIREGIANQSDLINRKLNENKLEITASIAAQTDLLNRKLNEMIYLLRRQQGKDALSGIQAPPSEYLDEACDSFEDALSRHPLLFAPKTYNTSHPNYDANLVRNFPGKIFNVHMNPNNMVYQELKKLIQNEEISEIAWRNILDETLKEAKSVPHAEQLFERVAYIEDYLKNLERKYQAYYRPGWVNMDDGIFLYWVVRHLKPKTIVQTGVCNGLSSAFMMLALAKNGPDGTLHVVDMPPIFNPSDPAWTEKGKVYGVTIPAGKTSGWIVPDAYHNRFEVLNGDAKLLLPGLLKKLGNIDMFYHDSDHTYDHMMFEFKEAKLYLNKSGVIVSDDISWNASLWDFADQYQAPAYNYRGSMGIACF